MNESTRHVDLLNAFDKQGCPICMMVRRDTKRDMDILMLERINKVETHLKFRDGRGLCNAHAWHIKEARGGSLSIAVMYDSTMLQLMKDLNHSGGSGGSFRLFGGKQGAGVSLANALEPAGMCLVCEGMNKNEDAYVSIIAENVQDEKLQSAYHASEGGICLPHVRLVLRKLASQRDIDTLMALQKAKWDELQADLQLFIEKNEDNIPQSAMGKEGDSWQRAIRYLSGEEDIFGFVR